MPKLINADSLADRLDALAYDDWNQGVSVSWAAAFRVFGDMVRDEIAVDAEPVRHGHWIEGKGGDYIGYPTYECSECGCPVGEEASNYCPHCGAKMDGEKNA